MARSLIWLLQLLLIDGPFGRDLQEPRLTLGREVWLRSHRRSGDFLDADEHPRPPTVGSSGGGCRSVAGPVANLIKPSFVVRR
jgi:hypothetical protein